MPESAQTASKEDRIESMKIATLPAVLDLATWKADTRGAGNLFTLVGFKGNRIRGTAKVDQPLSHYHEQRTIFNQCATRWNESGAADYLQRLTQAATHHTRLPEAKHERQELNEQFAKVRMAYTALKEAVDGIERSSVTLLTYKRGQMDEVTKAFGETAKTMDSGMKTMLEAERHWRKVALDRQAALRALEGPKQAPRSRAGLPAMGVGSNLPESRFSIDTNDRLSQRSSAFSASMASGSDHPATGLSSIPAGQRMSVPLHPFSAPSSVAAPNSIASVSTTSSFNEDPWGFVKDSRRKGEASPPQSNQNEASSSMTPAPPLAADASRLPGGAPPQRRQQDLRFATAGPVAPQTRTGSARDDSSRAQDGQKVAMDRQAALRALEGSSRMPRSRAPRSRGSSIDSLDPYEDVKIVRAEKVSIAKAESVSAADLPSRGRSRR